MEARKHRINIDSRYCKGCKLCMHVCKKGVFEPGMERSALGYEMPVVVRPERCVGCRMCEQYCPDMAVRID